MIELNIKRYIKEIKIDCYLESDVSWLIVLFKKFNNFDICNCKEC